MKNIRNTGRITWITHREYRESMPNTEGTFKTQREQRNNSREITKRIQEEYNENTGRT